MKISCVLSGSEVREPKSDIVLLPEYSSKEEIIKTSKLFKSCVVGGAYQEGNGSFGIILQNGNQFVSYKKYGSDGCTIGSQDSNQNTVVEINDFCLGILVCMDINSVELKPKTIEKMKLSKSNKRVLLVPGDMSSDWFSGDEISAGLKGVNVVLCNNIKTYQGPSRCLSFVSNELGKKIAVQVADKPLYAEIQ